jgi:chromosome partitioning protein
MQKIVILNPKGGAGKTTIATNLAACFAAHSYRPALLDLDPQGSSARWLRRRPIDAAPIHGIIGFERVPSVTRTWQLRVPAECSALIVDTPAAMESHSMPEVTRGATAVLVPVMPSEIDIHASAKCIGDLLLVAKMRRSEGRLAVVANRVRANTRISRSLYRFLESLDIPIVATFRDSQSYVRSAEEGIGVMEMPQRQVEVDVEAWKGLLEWLAERPPIVPQPGVLTPLPTR